ncbi:hypothetical protein H6796_01095 [Candidatus Nomurabacteria bacterium]|nr:hypothetical protein [Candidatus Nomurabacteria bacterium]
MVVDITVYIAVLLAFGLVFTSNHHIAQAATQQPAERLWVVVLGRSSVFATVDNFLDIIKQLFRDNRRMFALKHFARVAKMSIVKRIC